MIDRRLVAGVVLAVILGALSGCRETVDLAPRAQRQLQSGLDDVRAAVAAADRIDARASLRDLERAATSLADAGQISEERAADILAAVHAVADQLSLLPAPETSPSPSPEPTASPSEKPEESEKPEKPDKGHGHGHDEDRGNNDGEG